MWGSEQPNWGWLVEAETLDPCFQQVFEAWSLSFEMQEWIFAAIKRQRVQAQVWLQHWESQAHRSERWELFKEGQNKISSNAASTNNSNALNAAEISRSMPSFQENESLELNTMEWPRQLTMRLLPAVWGVVLTPSICAKIKSIHRQIVRIQFYFSWTS